MNGFFHTLSGSTPRNPSVDMDCAVVCLQEMVGIGARRLDPSYFLTRYPQLFVNVREKNERCHNEIGAPDYRIGIPFGFVLTPWDQNLFPVFGPVATAQEDSWRLDRVKSPLCQDRCRMREQMESGARERKRK